MPWSTGLYMYMHCLMFLTKSQIPTIRACTANTIYKLNYLPIFFFISHFLLAISKTFAASLDMYKQNLNIHKLTYKQVDKFSQFHRDRKSSK